MLSPLHDLAAELAILLKDCIPMSGTTRAISPMDLWPRLRSAMASASSGADNWPQWLSRALSKLQVETPPVYMAEKLDALRPYIEGAWAPLMAVMRTESNGVIACAMVMNKDKQRAPLAPLAEFLATIPAARETVHVALARPTVSAHGTTLRLRLTTIDALHHGAGVEGNTAVLRRQAQPDGGVATPFVSGGSIRNRLRRAAFDHAAPLLGLTARGQAPEVMDFLLRGGMMGVAGNATEGAEEGFQLAAVATEEPKGKTKLKKLGPVMGGQISRMRDVADAWPVADLLGYASGNAIRAGLVQQDNAHLVCRENAWRLPADIADHPDAKVPASRFVDTQMGTRLPFGNRPELRKFVDESAGDESRAFSPMPFEWEVVLPGANFYTQLWVQPGASRLALGALGAMVRQWMQTGTIQLGAKASIGHGKCAVQADWFGDAPTDADIALYETHLRENRSAIMTQLRSVA